MANWIPKIEYTELLTGTPKTITFDNPPEGDPLGESYKTKKIVTTSDDGTRQTVFKHTRKHLKVEFLFQSEAVKDKVVDFYNKHAQRGGNFKYFIHSDEVDFDTYEIDDRGLSLSRPIPNGVGDFEYDFKMSFSKVVV